MDKQTKHTWGIESDFAGDIEVFTVSDGDGNLLTNELCLEKARLIASAPELLEALKSVKSVQCGDEIYNEVNWDLIDKAIAKAEGK